MLAARHTYWSVLAYPRRDASHSQIATGQRKDAKPSQIAHLWGKIAIGTQTGVFKLIKIVYPSEIVLNIIQRRNATIEVYIQVCAFGMVQSAKMLLIASNYRHRLVQMRCAERRCKPVHFPPQEMVAN